ncbi:MAG: hypothetical protein H0V66_12920 [Bdellovibrionales bacterium]|nr:hypothetical protein [Bdellovibrionales bacterium]
MDKYRLLAHKDEILNMVKKAPVVEIGDIWQTLPFKRDVYKIKKLEIFSDDLIFMTTMPFEFEDDFPVYIRLNFKNLIFKLSPNEYKTFKNQMSCTLPKEAKAIEDRNLLRTKLPKQSHLNITLRTLSVDTALDIKVTLEDVSETGMGIKASSLNEDYFKRNNVFKIIMVCGRKHMEETTLTVKHISEKDHKSFIGVGLSGNVPFSDRLFEILREEMRKVKFANI